MTVRGFFFRSQKKSASERFGKPRATPKNRDSSPGRNKTFFFYASAPDRLWGSTQPPAYGHEGCFSGGQAAGRSGSLLSSIYYLHGVNSGSFSCTLLDRTGIRSATFPFRMDCSMNGRDISKLSVSDLATLILTLCQIRP